MVPFLNAQTAAAPCLLWIGAVLRPLGILPLFVVLALAGCTPGSSDQRLFLTRSFRTDDGRTAHYALFIPAHRDPDVKLPVILFLNGWGENGNDGLRHISNNFGGDVWRMRASFPFLAVCPQCSYNSSWTPGSRNANTALAVLDAAIREFNGDPDRVAVTGASTGGTGALDVAQAHPDRFSAVVPISAAIHLTPDELRTSRLPIWAFHNAGDASGLVRASRDMRKHHIEAGSSPLVTEFHQAGHNAWDPAYSSPALYQWLLAQSTSRSRSRGPMTFFEAITIASRWTTGDRGHWGNDADELECRAAGAEILSPEIPGDWALHFDVQIDSGQPATLIVQQGELQATLTAPLAKDGFARWTSPSTSVTLDPAAQRALRKGWNELRVERVQGKLSVTLNGWKGLEGVECFPGQPVSIGFSGTNGQRFRYVRLWQPAAGTEAP